MTTISDWKPIEGPIPNIPEIVVTLDGLILGCVMEADSDLGLVKQVFKVGSSKLTVISKGNVLITVDKRYVSYVSFSDE